MKIIQVEDFVHPDTGYEINLLSRLQAKDGHDVTIVAAELDKAPKFLTSFFGIDNMPERDARFFRETGVRIIRVPVFTFFSGRAVFYPRIFRIVNQLNPDAVFIHSQDSLIGILFIWLSPFLKYPIVLDTHSLEMGSQNRFRRLFRAVYKRLVAPVIVRTGIPIIRLVDSDYAEKCLGIPLQRTILLSFGTDTNLFQPDAVARARFRQEHQIGPDDLVLLYAGKLDLHKGGKLLAEAVKKKISCQSGRQVVCLIVGNVEGEYGKEVENVLSLTENRVIRLPTQRYLDLPKLYQGSDIALYPKQCSLSFFEAQSCGLPVVFETNEINDERARHGNALTFTPGDVEDMRAKVQQLIDMPAEDFRQMQVSAREYVVDRYNYVPIAAKVTGILREAAARRALKKAAGV